MLSIIIPIYNKATYLNQCLNSVACLATEDWECFLIDDGSTDESPLICDFWSEKDPRFVTVHHQNSGVSIARNIGIDLARGEWVYFLDADDHCLSLCYKEEEFYDADVVLGCFVNNETLVSSSPTKGFEEKNYAFDYLKEDVRCRMGSFFVKKALLDKHNIRFSPMCHFGEDLGFILRMLIYSKKTIFSNTVFCSYKNNPSSSSRQVTLAKFDVFFDRLLLIKDFPDAGSRQILNYLKAFSLIEAIVEPARDLLRNGMSSRILKDFIMSNPAILQELDSASTRKSLSLKFRVPAWLLRHCPIIYKLYLFLQNAGYDIHAFLGKTKRFLLCRA